MSLASKFIAPLLVSTTIAATTVAAQDVGTDDISYDTMSAQELGYCAPVTLATPTATEYFNLLGCEEGFMSAELLENVPRVPVDFVLPTVEDYNAGQAFARCVYGSLPGGAVIEDEAFGMVTTGGFVMTEDDLDSIKRIAAFECGLNLS
jgi:hypothetical protein